jgi:glucose/arabinose dehydrogenase
MVRRSATLNGGGGLAVVMSQEPAATVAADGFSFPTSVVFDATGTPYVAESGLPFGGAAPGGRVWRLQEDGKRESVAEGLGAPVNGLAWDDGALYVSDQGEGGRIQRIDLDGRCTTVLAALPGPGNYHTNMVAFGPEGKLYFSQGAMSNLAIVGLDAYEIGWLRRLPHAHDVPGLDVVLAGVNVETADPLSDGPDASVSTGAFVPFGTSTHPGQRVNAGLPCTAAVMRCNPDGSNLELVAWGLRNAFGLGFLADGRLLVTDQGADDRGSRPIGNAPDLLFDVRQGAWYGWPDFIGGDPVTDPVYKPQRGPQPTFVLAEHDTLPPPERPLLRFETHTSAVKFAVVPSGGFSGQLVVALFGDESPMTAPPGPQAGRTLVRVDPRDWSLHDLPASGLQRPIDVAFSPRDGAMHVLDFGRFEMTAQGVRAEAGTGRLLRMELSEDHYG